MASASSQSSTKKRHTFLNHFLPSKTLSIFRTNKSAAAAAAVNIPSTSINKSSTQYKSQVNLSCQSTNNVGPGAAMCMGRSWLKKRAKRPISLDLDLVKTLRHQNDEEMRQSMEKIGTNQKSFFCLDRCLFLFLFLFLLSSFAREQTRRKENNR